MNDKKTQYGTEINFENVKVGDGDSAKEIKDAKLKSHGLIAKDKDGKVVSTIDGHVFGDTEVQAVIDQLLPKKEEKSKEKKEEPKKEEEKEDDEKKEAA